MEMEILISDYLCFPPIDQEMLWMMLLILNILRIIAFDWKFAGQIFLEIPYLLHFPAHKDFYYFWLPCSPITPNFP